MLSSRSFSLRLLPPSSSPIRASIRSPASSPSHNLRLNYTSSRKTVWRISCFKEEQFSSPISKPDSIDEVVPQDLVNPDFDEPSVTNRNWITSLREACYNVHRVIGKRWTVPWNAETLLQVTVLWISAFWFVGSWIVPLGAYIAGLDKETLTYRGQALFTLVTDVTEGLAAIAILHRCLSKFRPLPSDWFEFNLKGNWLTDVTIGCLMFPLINRLSLFNLKLLPLLPNSPMTLSNIEQSIMARDPVAMGLYAMVVTVCAPVWEEIIFRGFLLPSLTKYMPVWCSILVSSVAFALAHFNVQNVLPLVFLGVVIGIIYSRSRNLFPPMLLHSLWNGFVFLDLMNKILAL